MPTTLSDTQKKILNFMVEIYDKEMHGNLDARLIISETRISGTVVRSDLLSMKERGLIKALIPTKNYAPTHLGVAKISKD